MLLESQLPNRTTLVFDAESVGGIDKGSLTVQAHPDKIVPRAVEMIRALATELSGIAGIPDAPDIEISFTVRVDSNAVVSIARSADEGQLRVTMRFPKK